MTNERINEISNFLAKDVEETKALLDLEPAEAAAKLSEQGLNVTGDELIAYAEALKQMSIDTEAELGESDLENVAGGVGFTTLLLIGIIAGYAMSKGKW